MKEGIATPKSEEKMEWNNYEEINVQFSCKSHQLYFTGNIGYFKCNIGTWNLQCLGTEIL